jgi:hypothetical protein
MYSELIKKRIDALATGENANTNDLGPDYWALIWKIVNPTEAGGLECIKRNIQKCIIPNIRKMFKRSELVRKLEMGDKATGSGEPKGLTTMCRCCIL